MASEERVASEDVKQVMRELRVSGSGELWGRAWRIRSEGGKGSGSAGRDSELREAREARQLKDLRIELKALEPLAHVQLGWRRMFSGASEEGP